jgi:hypothetical protein
LGESDKHPLFPRGGTRLAMQGGKAFGRRPSVRPPRAVSTTTSCGKIFWEYRNMRQNTLVNTSERYMHQLSSFVTIATIGTPSLGHDLKTQLSTLDMRPQVPRAKLIMAPQKLTAVFMLSSVSN